MNKPMTKQEWLSYLEKTWDAAQSFALEQQAAPPQQQSDPLTEKQRLDIVATALRGHASTRDAIQWAIEAAERHYGIKGKA